MEGAVFLRMLPLVHLLPHRFALCCIAQRTLFTLPDLSSLSPFNQPNGSDQEPQTYHERKILPYTSSQIYNIVTDVDSYPEFVAFCLDARVLSRTPTRGEKPESMQAEMTIGFLSFKESYISDVVCRPNQSVEITASSSTPLFRTLRTVWGFQPASPHSPHLTSRLPLATPSSSSSAVVSASQGGTAPTLITLDLAFSFANPVHAAVSATFFGQVSKMMVKAFEERCQQIYGPGSK